MPHRLSHLSAAALLTALLLLLLAAPTWAQGGDEPVSSDDPSAQGEESTGEEGGESDNCDPNYEGDCLDPDAEDYDCEGGSGDGPRFVRGPLQVVGDDPFELDTDDADNIACEESSASGGSGGGGDTDDDTPSGGVDSGFGPAAGDAPPPIALVGTSLGVLALVGLGLGVARTRRAG